MKFYLLVVVFFLFVECSYDSTSGSVSATDRPNILLIVSEDHGPDLGCYGTTEVTTPHLDNLARLGRKYLNAFVTYSVCSPSRSTMFTGLYPHQNGQIGLATHKYRMYESFKTLPVYLKEAGYRTGCLGKIHVNPEEAVPWDFHPIRQSNFAKKDLPLYAKYASEFITDDSTPFFLMVNFPDAHCDWQAQVEGLPEKPLKGDDVENTLAFVGVNNPRLRELTANYYNSINRLDASIGMILDSLRHSGKEENTLIIYLSDHGAQFSRGKCSNYESGLKIPFIIRWPGKVAEGQSTEKLVSTIDLLPTILSAAGTEVPGHLPGTSLLEKNPEETLVNEREYIFADGEGSAAFYHYPRRSVRDKRYKLIHNLLSERENPKYLAYAYQMYGTGTLPEELQNADPRIQDAYETWHHPTEFEFYDLQNDPNEFNNLIGDHDYQEQIQRLKGALSEWQRQTADPLANPKLLTRFTEEIDSVNARYPNRDYNKNPDFQWNYPEYFKLYIDSLLAVNNDLMQKR